MKIFQKAGYANVECLAVNLQLLASKHMLNHGNHQQKRNERKQDPYTAFVIFFVKLKVFPIGKENNDCKNDSK